MMMMMMMMMMVMMINESPLSWREVSRLQGTRSCGYPPVKTA